MLLDAVAGVDDVPVSQPRMVVEPDHLLGRILQVVVHGDGVGAARVAQPRHDRVVLAEVARVLDVGERHRGAPHQLLAHLAGIVGAAVVDQHDLQPADGMQRRQRLDQTADGGGAAIYGNDDGQADAGGMRRRQGHRIAEDGLVVHGRSAVASTDPPAGRRKGRRRSISVMACNMASSHGGNGATSEAAALLASSLRCATMSGSSRLFQ